MVLKNLIEKCELEVELKDFDRKFFESIIKTLKPDTFDLPINCSIDLKTIDSKLIIKIMCRNISNLRTLFFSYFTILSTLIELGESLNGSTETTTRGSTNNSSIPSY